MGTVLLVAVLLLLGLQTEPGATTAAQFLANRANPVPETRLTVERASGNWIQSLQLTNVSLTRTDSASGATLSMAQVDTLAAQYELEDLLWGQIHLTTVRMHGPSVTFRQAADSTWDWPRLLPSSQDTTSDTSAVGPVQIDQVRLTEGQFTADFYAEGRDSTARVQDMDVDAHALALGPSLGGQLDTLGLRAYLPGDTTALRLGASGALSSSRLRLDTLHLTSQRSRVRGHGTARLPTGSHDTLENVSLRLQADPLALRDLTGLVPTLDVHPRESVTLDADLTGSGQRLTLATEAQFSGGGHLTLHAEGTPRIEGAPGAPPLRYDLDAEIEDLSTSLIGPYDPSKNALSATVDASLQGQTLASLSGTVEARLHDTRLWDLRAPELRLRSTVQDGTAEGTVKGVVNGSQLSVQGSGRPFVEAPSVNLTSQVRDVSLSTVAPAAGVEGTLAATLQFEGKGITTPEATYTVDAALRPSQIGAQPIDAGQIAVSLRPDQIQADGTVTFPTGQLQAAGRATLDGSERFVLESARLDSVDVAALAGDTIGSRVSGSFEAQGQGFNPESAQGNASLRIQEARYGPHHASQIDATARFDAGRLTLDTSAEVDGGTWTLSVTGRPFAPVPSAEVTRGRFQGVDLGPFLQDTTQSTALSGTIQGRIQGTTPAALRLDAGLAVDTSRVNRQQISGASADVTLQDSTLLADLVLNTPGGTTQFGIEGRPFDPVPTYSVSDGSFENVDVGAIAGVPDLATQLSGVLSLTARGTQLSSLTLDSDLSLRESSINQAALSDGRLTIAAEAGRVTVEGQAAVAGGSLQFSGHLDSLAQRPSYALQGHAQSIDVATLAGLDTVRAQVGAAQWSLSGRGTTLETIAASAHLSASSVRAGDLRVDSVNGAGMLQDGLLTVDTVSVTSNAFEGRGQGSVALLQGAGSSDFDFRTTVSDVSPLRPFLGTQRLQIREGRIDAHVSGAAGQQRFDGTATVDGFIYENTRLGNAQLSFTGRRGSDQLLDRFTAEGEAASLSVSGFAGSQVRFDALYDGTSVDLSADVQFNQSDSANVRMTARPWGDPTDVRLHQLSLQLGPDQWSLQRATSITIGEGYQVEQLLLRSGSQQIAIDGAVALRGTQSLIVTAEDVRLGPVAPLLDLPGLGGRVTGTLAFGGTASAPTVDGRLDLNLSSDETQVGTLQLDIGYDDLAVALEAELTHVNGSVFTAEGSVPADLRLRTPTDVSVSSRPVRLDASARDFPINWIDPFLDPSTLRSVKGTLSGDVEVRGTPDQPALSGTVSVAQAGVTVPSLSTTYQNGSIALELSGSQVLLTEATLESQNDGSLRASGSIDLPKLTVAEYDVAFTASDFLAIDTRAYRRAVVDGNVTLRGTTRRPVLSGQVQVESGSVHYPDASDDAATSVAQVSLQPGDQLDLEERFGARFASSDTTTFDLYEVASLDLTVRISRNARLRSTSNPELNVQFSGDLSVQKAPFQDLQVFGSIQVIEGRSTVRQFGQEFQITEGTLTFNGDPADPSLDLAAVYEQRVQGTQYNEVRITLSLTGRLGDLSPSLSSEPPMSTRNILSYLTTGRPADALIGGGSEGGNLATQVALRQATNLVESLAANELGLDVVRLQVRTDGRSYFTIGRYLTPRFFVSIEQLVTISSKQSSSEPFLFIPNVTLEYQLTDYLLLRSLSGRETLQLNFLLEHSY